MTKKEIKELKVGVSVMHKRYGECVVKDILNVGIVLTNEEFATEEFNEI